MNKIKEEKKKMKEKIKQMKEENINNTLKKHKEVQNERESELKRIQTSNEENLSNKQKFYKIYFQEKNKNKELIKQINDLKSQLQTNDIKFKQILDEKEKELKNSYYKELGSSELLKNSLMPFSKLLSRFSQNFTSTNAYNLPFEYEIIPDIKSKDGK